MKRSRALHRGVLMIGGICLSLTVTAPIFPASAAFPGQDGKIAYGCEGDLCLIDASGTGRTVIHQSLYGVNGPEFSPDGRKIAFLDNNGALWVVNSDGSKPAALAPTLGMSDNGVSWTPEGRIVFYPYAADDFDVPYVIDVDGGPLAPYFPADWGAYSSLATSPNGLRVAFNQGKGGGGRLMVADRDGSDLRELSVADPTGAADWSPDSTRLLFRQYGFQQAEGVWVIGADGTGAERLTEGYGEDPQWSPQGTRMVFWKTSTGIFVMNPDGTNRVYLEETGGIYPQGQEPSWQPLCASACPTVPQQREREATGVEATVPSQDPFTAPSIPVSGSLQPAIAGAEVRATLVAAGAGTAPDRFIAGKDVLVDQSGRFSTTFPNPYLKTGRCFVFVEYLATDEVHGFSAYYAPVDCTKNVPKITGRAHTESNNRTGVHRVVIAGEVSPAHPGKYVVVTASKTKTSRPFFKKRVKLNRRSKFSTDFDWFDASAAGCNSGPCVAKLRFLGDQDHFPDEAIIECC